MQDEDHNYLTLQSCLEVDSGLTAWEIDFLDSLNGQANHDHQQLPLTEKQQDCLDRIWTKLFA